ncbi:MAG: hypothetical protein QXE57_06440 [Nitrososphaerales archaeon]
MSPRGYLDSRGKVEVPDMKEHKNEYPRQAVYEAGIFPHNIKL